MCSHTIVNRYKIWNLYFDLNPKYENDQYTAMELENWIRNQNLKNKVEENQTKKINVQSFFLSFQHHWFSKYPTYVHHASTNKNDCSWYNIIKCKIHFAENEITVREWDNYWNVSQIANEALDQI